MDLNNKKAIYEKAIKIWLADDLTSEEKYELIFSENISYHFDFDWYDPDSSYEDDVNYYMMALKEHMLKLERIDKYL